jgi:glycosyltransferase involved in cell wall biosynthesis
MAAGTPYLAIMDKSSDIAVMAEKHAAGMWVEPGSMEDIVEQIQEAYHNREKLKEFGENGRRAAEDHYSRPLSMQKFHNLFESLTTNRS